MNSKLTVLRINRLWSPPVRHFIGRTPLEKFERLRSLCCTSELEKEKEKVKNQLQNSPTLPVLHDEVNKNQQLCVENVLKVSLDVREKTCMVLGGASGIGLETAIALLKACVKKVVIADINQSKGIESVKKLCSQFGNDKVVFLMTDIRQQSSLEMAFKEVYKHLSQIEIYVNCVGVYDETPQCWETMVRTNLLGCVRGTLLAFKYMSQNEPDDLDQGSVIINVSSYGSFSNIPSMPIFSASANGIIGLTSSFGQEFHYSKSKIRCLTICPACTESGLLKSMDKNHYDKQWAPASMAAMKCCTKQGTEIVGKAILHAIMYGINGNVYVVKEGKFFRYVMPDYMRIMRQETILL